MLNFDTFGVMIDCSRNGVPNIPALKNYLQILAKMGYNCAMLYTEDTYEIPDEPFWGYKRGKFTVTEMQELDYFASSIGIELIPCIQTLAHVNAAFRWDQFRKLRDYDDILMIDEEGTYELIEKMFKTLSSCFRSRRIHIGMDEAEMVGLGQYFQKHGYQDRHEILLRHLNRVCKIASNYGYETLMWDDMFFKLSRGYYIGDDSDLNEEHFSDQIRQLVPDNCSMVYWDYYSDNENKYDVMLRSSKNLSEKVWFAGGAWCWGTITPHNRVSISRNQMAINSCIRNGVRNFFITMWGDDGAESNYYEMLPALMEAAALAQGLSEKEKERKFKEITKEKLSNLLCLDLPNYIFGKDKEVGVANYSKTRLYNDPFLGIEDKNPEEAISIKIFKDYGKILHRLGRWSKNFKELYEKQACLCDLLYLKYDLGIRTRTLYEAKDLSNLRMLAIKDYSKTIHLINKFYEAHRNEWEKVYKPYGFEVQDIRLGGLVKRLENCKRRLISFADGKISSIPELEEPVLPHDGPFAGTWNKDFTANILTHQLF